MSHAVGKSDEFLSSQPCSSSNSVKSIVYQRPSVHAKTLARSAVIEIRVMTPEALTTMWKSSKLQTACKKYSRNSITAVPEALGRWAALEHEDGDVDKVVRLEFSLWFMTPVQERECDGDREEQTADHDKYLFHLVLIILLYLLPLHVSIPSNIVASICGLGAAVVHRYKKQRSSQE